MTRRLRYPGLLAWLTAVWVALWGQLSAANVLGGLAVAALLLVLLPVDPAGGDAPGRVRTGRVRPVGLLRLAAVFLVELVVASGQVSVLALRPGLRLRPAVLALPVHGSGDRLLTLVADAITLTPGTLTLEVDRDRSLLHVHVLHLPNRPGAQARVRRSMQRLERAARYALGQP